jgi:superfamily I DNA and/or RNA helicase
LLSKVIQTSQLDKNGNDKRLEAPVILSTISQMSNPKIGRLLSRKKACVHWIMDEATQICEGEIPHVLNNYASALVKVTFVGDEKQLSPFGSDNHSHIKSPFDRLECPETFLNVTYRLPFEIATFISRNVYQNKLCPFKKATETFPILFVNVPGKEQERNGKILVI